MIVVADTSPLNYLVRIELVEVLRKLYGSVVIPPEVRDELLAKDSPAIVRNRALDLPSWVAVRAPHKDPGDDARLRSLDSGNSRRSPWQTNTSLRCS